MTDAKKANGSKRTRSPAVPSYSLQESISEVHKVYDAYGRTGISKSEVASALKMSSDSGPFNSKIFTLKEYGLLDGSSDEYRVSQAFMDLKENGLGTAAFKRAALAAIKRSIIFAWLLSEFPTKLPAAEHLATRL
jgi:hypothetical protein